MKKSNYFFIAAFISVALVSDIEGQQTRRADSVRKFFIMGTGGIDRWPHSNGDTSNYDRWGVLGSGMRYLNLYPQDTGLSLNGEIRGIWDIESSEDPYPYGVRPAIPPEIAIGGQSEPLLDVISLAPVRLFAALSNARILRFETERHGQRHDTAEYCGYLTRSGLRGTNVKATGATYPKYIAGFGAGSDTSVNAVRLKAGVDAPGVFADSMSYHNFLTRWLWRHDDAHKGGRHLKMRCRFKVDSAMQATGDSLFKVRISLRHKINDSTIADTLVLDTVVFCDANLHHIGSDFDTIDLPVVIKGDFDLHTVFELSWQGKISLTFDYVEILTAAFDYTIPELVDEVSGGEGLGPGRGYGRTYQYSYEELTENNEAKLKAIVDTLVRRYKNKAQYIWVQEEASISMGLLMHRARKLLREASGGAMDIVAVFPDSGQPGCNLGVPNAFLYQTEAVSRGWLDSSRYADPTTFFGFLSTWLWRMPMPKRTTTTDSAELRQWEIDHASGWTPYLLNPAQYRNSYNYLSQYFLDDALRQQRVMLRAARRNTSVKQRFIQMVQGGTGADILVDTSTTPHTVKIGYGIGIYPPTGAQFKELCNISVSTGASGLILYTLVTYGGGNGGLMFSDGSHDEQLHEFTYFDTTLADTIRYDMWMGFKERFDTAAILLPRMRIYGDALLNAKSIAEFTAAEAPVLDTSLRNRLPFFYNSVRALDDNLNIDTLRALTGYGSYYNDQYQSTEDTLERHLDPDTANRTFVHFSLWVDTVGGRSDTLLYITNMRTDDSYDTTEVCSMQDRRLVTLQMKAAHLITDVADTSATRSLDRGVIWTPYVGAGDSLRVLLLPGDGVLVRLDSAPAQPMQQMRVAINYPVASAEFNDHGRVKFDRVVEGVRDRTSDKTVPSTRYSYIGIKDADTVRLWQDSLLYQTVHQSREGKWRHHHWVRRGDQGDEIIWSFVDTLNPNTPRVAQLSVDSLAHPVVIKTETEIGTSPGKIRLYDPWFVDSVLLVNYDGTDDTLAKLSPFLPHILAAGSEPGAHPEGYGGVFRAQNPLRSTDTTIVPSPMYTIGAYSTIRSDNGSSLDTLPGYTDWSFIEWHKTDTLHPLDPSPWRNDTMSRKIDVIFMKDSAQYVARYKAHMAAYSTNGGEDSGYCCNNQRKLFYAGRDTLDQKLYRLVYGSKGRVYTSEGYHYGPNNNNATWHPERLLTPWLDADGAPDTMYQNPAMGYHPGQAIKWHYAYQDVWGRIHATRVETDGTLNHFVLSDYGSSFSLPAIASTDMDWSPVDVVAWVGADQSDIDGIHLRAIGNWNNDALGSPPDLSLAGELVIGNGTARYPTVWMDTCFDCTDTIKSNLWVAWQQEDTVITPIIIPPNPPMFDTTIRIDIFASQFEVTQNPFGNGRVPQIIELPNNGSDPVNVSLLLTPASEINRRPCIAGMRVDDASTAHRVKLAYEAEHGPPTAAGCQGINIADNLNGNGWTNVHFLTSCDTTDKFWKPSIEITRYQKLGGDTLLPQTHWYSLIYEGGNGTNIQHWAFDSATQRLVPAHLFLNLHDPQIAVTPDKVDSSLYRMAQSHPSADPRWMISGYSALYKLGNVDTLWGYHTMSEPDTSGALLLTYGFGELGYDDGDLTEFDLLDRDETETVDSSRTKEYFMRSVNFTLPASSTFQWCPWVRTSDDVIFDTLFGTVRFALDFYDEDDNFVMRLDSLELNDSVLRIESDLRQASIDRDTAMTGYVAFHRISAASQFAANGMPTNIISTTRLSSTTAAKRARQFNQTGKSGIAISLEPNPAQNEVSIHFDLPAGGPVTMQLYDQLGRVIQPVADGRVFSRGEHTMRISTTELQEGVYYVRFVFGNEVITEKLMIVR